MDVQCNDPFPAILNDGPKQDRVKSVKIFQSVHNDAANDVFKGQPLKKKRLLEKEKDEGEGEIDKACNMQQYPSRSLLQSRFPTQVELEKMYGKRSERKIECTANSSSKKSQSSKVKERIILKELKKSEGYGLFKEALDAHVKKAPARST
ncbi:uncharacterized protein LOC111328217 [Stylophora pistillata]|uniref:uncharacterized protein LOC111328217 n=1 Tax=Stylophora pistillata TaxID=50429 RepID=UPI000C054B1D|nr:uncharacterized protein LOC111328217 [Stylophora pistillata]